MTSLRTGPLGRFWAGNEGFPAGVAVLIGRALAAELFINEGVTKVGEYASTAQYMQTFGVPSLLEPFAIFVEIVGGLLALVGLMTRPVAIALCLYTLLLALLFHRDFADADQFIHFQKNLAIAGGWLILAVHGPGAWSLDAWLARRGRRR